MIKAVIFDFDGIIIDSEPMHFEAHRRALWEAGMDLTLDDYFQYGLAKGDKDLCLKMAEKYGIALDIKKILGRKREIYQEIFDKGAKLENDAINLIERLKDKYTLAIASSSSRESLDYACDRLDIKKYFSVIVSGSDVEKVKPAPDIYLKAAELLGLAIDECLSIEDSETGLEASVKAGIKCIACPREFTRNQNFEKASVIVNNLNEINDQLIGSI
jgi:HAD superfamily hydrolase (TIGR01509 family)